MQEAIVIALFVAALIYLGRVVFKSTKAEGGCSSSCGCESPVKHLQNRKIT